MSILYFFSGLGKFIFSIRKIDKIKNIIINNNFTNVLNKELPKLGCLLYLSCIV